jgi:tRNA pseudouridine55 synthase
VLSGVVLVDKPTGPTSHDVVAIARRTLGLKKVGHAGTLDPMASGLLTLGIGPGTKLLTYLVGADKRYQATIRLGQSTTTDDAEGDIAATAEPAQLAALTEEAIRDALSGFVGQIDQVPSSVSAIKIGGKRAYDLVRAGEEVDIPSRRVTIHRLEVGQITPGDGVIDVDVDVWCSSGTYIRAIARDLGDSLRVGGHLTMLRRSQVGPFDVAQACDPDNISPGRLLSLADVASAIMPVVQASPSQTVEIGHGKQVFLDAPDTHHTGEPVGVIDPNGRLIAIVDIESGRARILVGFPES